MPSIPSLVGQSEASSEAYEITRLFHHLLLLRALRPDKVVPGIMDFISRSLSPAFIEPQPFNLLAGYNDSTCLTPLIFVLTPGTWVSYLFEYSVD